MAEKSATQILTLTEIDAMFLCVYGWQMRDSGHVVVCKKGGSKAQEEMQMLALSGTQKHLGGPLCAQISYRKIACAVVCPSQTTRQLASATYSRDGVICIWPRAI